jgi:hypothetical protein
VMMFTVPAVVGLLATAGPIRFEDIAEKSGIPTDAAKGASTTHAAALAWFDHDLDGYVDLLVGQAAGPTLLFQNGGAAGTFTEATPDAIAAITNVVAIDIATTLPHGPGALSGPTRALALLAGTPEARLVVVTIDSLGVLTPVPVGQPARALDSLTHGDLDGDGLQELIVTQRACAAPVADLNTVFRLSRTAGGFHTAGASDPFLGQGCTPVPIVTDFDGNGRPVLLVATDFGGYGTPSYVMRSTGPESLLPAYGRGVAVGDENGDGVIDYTFTSTLRDVTLRSGEGGRTHVAGPPSSELGESGTRDKWGAAYLDADNDGALEFWATVGEVTNPVSVSDPNGRDLLVSGGVDIAPSAGVDAETDNRVITLADWNRDGRMDAAVGGPGGIHLYKNVTDAPGHWVELVVPDLPGTRYEFTACDVTHIREWTGGGGHQPIVHVGLGACTQAPSVRVRYPWVGSRDLGTAPIDALSEFPTLGDTWVSPRVVVPGDSVVVHTIMAGAVTADGVLLVDGTATLVAPAVFGPHAVALTIDGAPVDLAPSFTVIDATGPSAAAVPEVFTDPWPPRIGEPAVLYGADASTVTVEAGATLDGSLLTATTTDVTLSAGGRTIHIAAVPRIGPLTTLTSERRPSGGITRVVLADGYGAAIPSIPSDVTLIHVDPAGVPGDELPMMPLTTPWWFAPVPASAMSLRLVAGEQTVVERRYAPTVVSTPDLTATAFWPTIPWVRADGQDILTLGLALIDKNGQLVTPGPAFAPTATGCTAIDSAWTNSLRLFGLSHWTFRLRAPTEPGRIDITAGPLVTTAWAVPKDHAPVDMGRTELRRTATGLELVPRDSAKRLVGSGLTTDPPFEYAGLGRYTLEAAPTEANIVTVDGSLVFSFNDAGGVDKDVIELPTDAGGAETDEEFGEGQGELDLQGDLGPSPTPVEFDFTLPDIVFVTPQPVSTEPGGCQLGRQPVASSGWLSLGGAILLVGWLRRRRCGRSAGQDQC